MDLAFFLSLPHAALADLGRSTTHYSGPELSNLIAAAEKVCDDTKSQSPHRRLQSLRYLHDCSDCYRLERKSTMMMSIMIIAIVIVIYVVRLAGRFAIVLAFLPAAFWLSLAKPLRNSLNGRTFWPTLAASSAFR